MRKLSEIKGEEALDVLAEILIPITAIVTDDEVRSGFETNVATCACIAIKKHKEEVIDILSKIDGTDKEEFLNNINILTLPSIMIDVLNEPMVQELFQ